MGGTFPLFVMEMIFSTFCKSHLVVESPFYLVFLQNILVLTFEHKVNVSCSVNWNVEMYCFIDI